jgi:hypothetical protein
LILKGLPSFLEAHERSLNAYSMHRQNHELHNLPGQAHSSPTPHLGYHTEVTVLSAAVSCASMKNRDIGMFPI